MKIQVFLILFSGLFCIALPVGGIVCLRKKYRVTARPFVNGILALLIFLLWSVIGFYLDKADDGGLGFRVLSNTAEGLFYAVLICLFVRFMMDGRRSFGNALGFGVGFALVSSVYMGLVLMSVARSLMQSDLSAVPDLPRMTMEAVSSMIGVPCGMLLYMGFGVLAFQGLNAGKKAWTILMLFVLRTLWGLTADMVLLLSVPWLSDLVSVLFAVLMFGFIRRAKSTGPWQTTVRFAEPADETEEPDGCEDEDTEGAPE